MTPQKSGGNNRMHNNDSLERVTRLLERSAPVLAATVGLDGRPQLRPVPFLLSENDTLYFLTAKSCRLYAELSRTPFVQIFAFGGETEAGMRIAGKVCFAEDETLLERCLELRPELPEALGTERKTLIAFFLVDATASVQDGLRETALEELRLPDPSGVLVGITIRKKTELRDRISRILERREAEPPALPDEELRLYDGALLLFAEAAKKLWPRMDVRSIERAAVFETWDEREKYMKLAASLIGNAVIGKPEDLSYWLNPETLTGLRAAAR